MDMKKRASTIRLVMWIVVIYLSVAAVPAEAVTQNAGKSGQVTDCRNIGGYYLDCGAKIMPGADSHCAEAPPNRACCNINPDT